MERLDHTNTLIIRFWHERDGTGRPVLRGSIDHVQSGEKIYFQTVEDLINKLGEFLPAPSADPRQQGNKGQVQ